MLSDNTKNHKIKGIPDFIQKISELALNQDYNRFFRGHSDYTYELTPSIYRGTAINNEDSMINEILSSCPNDFSQDKSIFEKLTRLQHYGFPTRLLDITTNPLVALYFAVESNKDKDGEVIIFDIPKDNIKYSNSDTVSIISATSFLPKNFSIKEINEFAHNKLSIIFKEKILKAIIEQRNLQEIGNQMEELYPEIMKLLNSPNTHSEPISIANKESIEKEIINQHNDVISLVHFVRDEKPGFRNAIKLDDLKKVLCVIPKQNNIRVANQQGAFLLFGIDDAKTKHADIAQQNINITQEKIIIDKNAKQYILKQLEGLGISQQFLFPELEKQAEYIKKKYSK